MTITLDRGLEKLIREKIETGSYGDADEVIRAALHALDEQDRLDRLRSALQIGLDQLDRGEGRPFTPELFEEIKRNARRKAAAGHTPNPDVCP